MKIQVFSLFIILLFPALLISQQTSIINSNYLVEKGLVEAITTNIIGLFIGAVLQAFSYKVFQAILHTD